MAMFVQGFWCSARLVGLGNTLLEMLWQFFGLMWSWLWMLQMHILHLIALAKGKFAMASSLRLVMGEAQLPVAQNCKFSAIQQHWLTYLKKINPSKCNAKLTLHNLTFTYPSWLTTPILSNVSAYETTFIVSRSGCSKSIIAVLLLGLHAPQECTITLTTGTSYASHSNSPKPMLLESHRLQKHLTWAYRTTLFLVSQPHRILGQWWGMRLLRLVKLHLCWVC